MAEITPQSANGILRGSSPRRALTLHTGSFVARSRVGVLAVRPGHKTMPREAAERHGTMLYISGTLEGGWLKPRSSGAGVNPRIGVRTGVEVMNALEFGYLWAAKGVTPTRMEDQRTVEYTNADGSVSTKTRFTTVRFTNPDGEEFVIREGDVVHLEGYWNRRYDDLVFTRVVSVEPAEREDAEQEVPAEL